MTGAAGSVVNSSATGVAIAWSWSISVDRTAIEDRILAVGVVVKAEVAATAEDRMKSFIFLLLVFTISLENRNWMLLFVWNRRM